MGYLYNFGAKYWNILDWDMSGSLDFQEFKWGMGALAATNALVVSDADGLLSGSELTAWKSQFVSTASNWGWSVSDDKVSALKAAYAGAQLDGDFNTASLAEIARFELNAANVFLK